MMECRPVTQRDIAQRAGVHVSTVSLALKRHPGIPESTRNRIFKIAQDLGYASDSVYSALAKYRMNRRIKSFRGTIAWLVNHNFGSFDWKSIPIYQEYYLGAKNEAKIQGYDLKIFDLNKGEDNKDMLAASLVSQDVNGILLCPQRGATSGIDFPWQHFSTISFGYSLSEPRFHIVSSAQYRCVAETMDRMHALGYKRIGYISWSDSGERSNNNALAAYLVKVCALHSKIIISPLLGEYKNRKILLPWLNKYRPDAVISADASFINTLRQFNFKIPQDMGFACFALSNSHGRLKSDVSGIDQNSKECGRAAVKLLVGMIQYEERGIPDIQRQLLISGSWISGKSVTKQ